MKKLIAIIVCIETVFVLNAQTTLKVREESRTMSKGLQNAFVVNVPQYKANDLKKEWSKFIKDNSSGKTSESKGEFLMPEGTISKISLKPLHHYALFNETLTGAEVAAFFEQDSSFVSSSNHPQMAVLIQKLMFEFAKRAYIKAVEEELEKEQKVLKEKQDEQEKLIKSENKAREDIVESNNNIEKFKNDLLVKKQDQELKQNEVNLQREKVIGVNQTADEKKLHDKLIKDLENDKKKLIKEQGKLRKDILNEKKKIGKEERNIGDLKHKQEIKAQEIERQQEIVQKVRVKLEDIQRMQIQ